MTKRFYSLDRDLVVKFEIEIPCTFPEFEVRGGGEGGGLENYIFVTPLIVFYRSFLIVSHTFHYPLPTEEV